MTKTTAQSNKETEAYEERKNWPPYTYRDYPDIKAETYESFLKFLDTENTTGRLMELQPWVSVCDSRCAFCYFPTTAASKVQLEPYLDLVKKELAMYAKTKYVKTSVFDEIVLGGGTPSVLSAEQIIDLIDFCKANFNTSKEYFIKITGSSKTLALSKIDKLAKYGVYQMDMGAQTFDDKLRHALCLPDSAADVEKAIQHARKLDLVVCVDLMYNLPGQTMESWETTLQKAIDLDAEIDAYALHVDPGTLLEKMIENGQSPPQGDSEVEKQMYLKAYTMLTKAGYKAVGHDRFSRVEWHMRENCLNGWPWGGILTTGAGCFMGYLQRFSYSNIEDINEYMKVVSEGRLPIQRLSESNDDEMMRREMSRLYLRLPVSKKEFQEKFGKLPEDVFPKQLQNLKEKGLIEIDDTEIRITKQGEVWKGNIAWEFATNHTP
ncbi:MAG: coproporphyrinogen III oxidase family protein [Nitrososphaerota archaeon]|jgi:oxygen-independent coproporphyrinogen-3 oxidase|uniref:coproporphyrinogen-III oxidase family protein n=1 Tax=Candidatus Bathycorpusculum sp. TaxID=2994959 RepID=UPI0028233762|nr:coproporphyrinogen III oxidase family protein [Candidatus Termitimicrobium sp.]MCL2432218.1 coproporphyrinogen III oxidase family protein [Candidatus Termitimicrobium sp.]MDR0493068.1 coproporphyrinogen III oxidase family protein [Nitrososphaerota archaeon]